MPASGLLDVLVSLTLSVVGMIQVSGIRILEVTSWDSFSSVKYKNLKSTLSYASSLLDVSLTLSVVSIIQVSGIQILDVISWDGFQFRKV